MHLAFFMLALSVMVMSFAMNVTGTRFVYLPGVPLPLPESCTTKLMLGIECPGCGMTRAFISISNGQFARAWRFNPASFVAYFFVAIQLPWQLIQMYRLWTGRPSLDGPWLYFLPVAVAATMLIQWIVRLSV